MGDLNGARRAGGALLLALLVLAACVPVPQPFLSPPTFRSPLVAPQTRLYYPIVFGGEPGKIGVSMALGYRDCAHPGMVGATWHFDWSPQPLDCPGLEGVPMIYAPGDGISNPPPASKYLLMFNECDLLGQCGVTPEVAAVAWRGYEQAYPDRLLVGPNTSHLGWQWLLDWHAAYIRLYGEPPRLHALGVHCYLQAGPCRDWVERNIALAKAWTTSGKVWVTEWAIMDCYYGAAGVASAASQARHDADEFMAWLLTNPAVERAAWFIARLPQEEYCQSELIDAAGRLTTWGQWHRDIVQVAQ